MKAPRAERTADAPRRTTLLELVQSLSRQGTSECEVVTTVLELVESGRVVLIGNFRGLPLGDPSDDAG